MPDSVTLPVPAKPLRILIGADTFLPEINGAAVFAARLAAGMVRRGHDVHVMAPSPTGKPGSWTEVIEGEEMTVHRLYSWRWYPHPWLRFALPWRVEHNSARILDLVKPDVVHFQSHLIIGRGLSHQASKRGIRIIGTNHFMPENLLEHSLIPRFIWPWAIRTAWRAAAISFGRAQAVTSPTRKAADFLEQNIGHGNVIAISCGIDMHHYTPNFEPRTENRILFVGRITGEKQLDKLVRAFAKLDPALNASLELVGGGDQEGALRQLASSLGVGARVTITGYVEEAFLRQELSRATVFAMPSIAELQSIATMEAMAAGLPIVAANAMALPHLVHDGDNGFLFEPGNVDDLAARLTEILTMPEDELQKLKKASLEIVAAHDISGTLDTFERLYRGEMVTDSVIERPLGKRARLRAKLRELTDSFSRDGELSER